MSKRLPPVKGKDAVAAFGKAGFYLDRVQGSHYILRHPKKVSRLSIPVHGAKEVGEGLLRSQIKAAGMTIEEFLGLL